MPKGVASKKYSGEFKQKVIEYMLEHKLSHYETERIFNVTGHDSLAKWERIYLTEGPEGLYIERRGRPNLKKELPKQVEEDLLKEVHRLRAEVAYLKKLNALVLEKELRKRRP